MSFPAISGIRQGCTWWAYVFFYLAVNCNMSDCSLSLDSDDRSLRFTNQDYADDAELCITDRPLEPQHFLHSMLLLLRRRIWSFCWHKRICRMGVCHDPQTADVLGHFVETYVDSDLHSNGCSIVQQRFLYDVETARGNNRT